MNTPQDISITIPAAIAALSLTLVERAALAHVAQHPGCSNRTLSKLLGISVRGAENLLRRLRDRKYIRQGGEGRARRLALTFPVEHHLSCGKSHKTESHTQCVDDARSDSVAQQVLRIEDSINLEFELYDNCVETGMFEAARRHLEAAHRRLEAADTIPVERKAKWIAALKFQEDRCFAYEFGQKMIEEGLASGQGKHLALTLCRASAPKLALFRERIESGSLPGSGDGILGLLGE